MIQCFNCRGEVTAEHFPVASKPDAPRLWLIELLAEQRTEPCIVSPAPRRESIVWTPGRGGGMALARSLRAVGASQRDVIAFHGDVKVARLAARLATIEGLIAGTLEI